MCLVSWEFDWIRDVRLWYCDLWHCCNSASCGKLVFFVWIECYVNRVTRPMLLLGRTSSSMIRSNGQFSCSCQVPCQLSLLDWLNVWFTLSCCWTHLYSCIIFVFDTGVLFQPLFCRLSFYCFISVWFYPVDTSCMYGIAGRLLRPHAEPSCWRMPDLFPS